MSTDSTYSGKVYSDGIQSGFLERNEGLVELDKDHTVREIMTDKTSGLTIGDLYLVFLIKENVNLHKLFPSRSCRVQCMNIVLLQNSRFFMEVTSFPGEIFVATR